MDKNQRRYGSTGLFAQPMGNLLEKVTAPVRKKYGSAKMRLFGLWREVVGEELAAKCRPHRLTFPKEKQQGGTLTLRVQSGFALEIQHDTPRILEKITLYFGYRLVEQLRIEQQ